jgi:hypothetical protein
LTRIRRITGFVVLGLAGLSTQAEAQGYEAAIAEAEALYYSRVAPFVAQQGPAIINYAMSGGINRTYQTLQQLRPMPTYNAPAVKPFTYAPPPIPNYVQRYVPTYPNPPAPQMGPVYSRPPVQFKAPSYSMSTPTYVTPTYAAPTYSTPTYGHPTYAAPSYSTPTHR